MKFWHDGKRIERHIKRRRSLFMKVSHPLCAETDSKAIRVDTETAHRIIETYHPRGLFYLKENGIYVGIDNSTGNAWCEEFSSRRKCLKWLYSEDPA